MIPERSAWRGTDLDAHSQVMLRPAGDGVDDVGARREAVDVRVGRVHAGVVVGRAVVVAPDPRAALPDQLGLSRDFAPSATCLPRLPKT